MNTKLKASLEEAIQEWIDKNCDSDGWAEEKFHYPFSLAQDMTNAAESVFDATVNGQKWLKEMGE